MTPVRLAVVSRDNRGIGLDVCRQLARLAARFSLIDRGVVGPTRACVAVKGVKMGILDRPDDRSNPVAPTVFLEMPFGQRVGGLFCLK
jgi:hypothetical protein